MASEKFLRKWYIFYGKDRRFNQQIIGKNAFLIEQVSM